MKKDFEINYEKLPIMSVGFVKSDSVLASIIRFFTHSKDVNHVFFVTIDRGQKFATEETAHGLQELSLEQYTVKKQQIIKMFVYSGGPGWPDNALDYLAEIRRKKLENSQYDFLGLLSFVPFLKLFIKPDKEKQWCSENVASILKKFGACFITKVEISPKELMEIMSNASECFEVFDFYKKHHNNKGR